MKVEKTNNIRVLTPESGMYLYNEKMQIIGSVVCLGIEVDESDWAEITQERKEELESLWNEDETSDDATIEDYQNALEELGVKL